MKLLEKTALVTGSSQGLGRVIAITLARAGAHVMVNCHSNLTRAQHVVDEIVQLGGQATPCCCDVADEQAVAAMFANVGPVDILVNNARIDPYFRTPEDTDAQWFNRVLQVNLTGAYNCSLAFFEQAKARHYGRIVNVSSVRSFIPAEMPMIAYGVSKLGMHGLTRAFAANGAPYGITANTVAPGMILTENIDKRLTPEMKARESAKIPLGRGATCEEIADAVLFLINNAYITGETININGGMYYAP
ncbi:MAG TPA: SDR family NAD(P)-dependent oxidoreductase [Armatimonadota bacterium]|jgi:3-oxoacyl-[acyl-carrier protein] reductase